VPCLASDGAGHTPGHDTTIQYDRAIWNDAVPSRRGGQLVKGETAPSRHGGRRPAIHAFAETRTVTRGSRTGGRHNGSTLPSTRPPVTGHPPCR